MTEAFEDHKGCECGCDGNCGDACKCRQRHEGGEDIGAKVVKAMFSSGNPDVLKSLLAAQSTEEQRATLAGLLTRHLPVDKEK